MFLIHNKTQKVLCSTFGVHYTFICIFYTSAQELKLAGWEWSDHRNTLSVSAGYVSTWYLLESLVTWIPAAADHAQNGHYYGAYGLQYHYQCLQWIRAGMKATWEGNDYEMCKKESDDSYTRIGHAFCHTASLMGSIQFTYLNCKHIQLYSGLDLGVGMYLADRRYDEGYANSNGETHPVTTRWLPAFNITALGFAFGGQHLFGLIELNAGYEALIKAGIGLHL